MLWYFNGIFEYKQNDIVGSIALGIVVAYFADCFFFQGVKLIAKEGKTRKEFKLNKNFIFKVILLNIVAGLLIFHPESKEEIIYCLIGSLLVSIGFLAKVYQLDKRSQ